MENKLCNLLGGCCGTTPEHIHALDQMLQKGKNGVSPSPHPLTPLCPSPPAVPRHACQGGDPPKSHCMTVRARAACLSSS